MAFGGDDFNLGTTIFDSLVNMMFLCDIIMQFFTAFYDIDYNIVDTRKVNTSVIKSIYRWLLSTI